MMRTAPLRTTWTRFVCVALLLTGCAFGQPSAAPLDMNDLTKYASFWGWFRANQEDLLAFDKHVEASLDSVQTELDKIHPDLGCEFGPLVDARREFVVTARGIKSAFPHVKALVGAAPKLEKWKITAFRPRHTGYRVKFASANVGPEDVFATVEPDGPRLSVTLFIRGFKSTPSKDYEQVGYLMLDGALGEYDVETKVGGIEIRALTDERLPGLVELDQLAGVFDKMFASLPPNK